MLAYGTTWVNAMDCRFEDNQVGFRFNAEGTVVTHTQYVAFKYGTLCGPED